MAHVPHLYIAPPWPDEAATGGRLTLPASARHHLERVLRRSEGEVSYTDGQGTLGSGRLAGAELVRGAESTVPRSFPHLTVAVAPLQRTERTRFLVEKLSELGVTRLRWVRTAYTVGRPPAVSKATAWAVGGLEQSRGAHLLDVAGTSVALRDVTDVTDETADTADSAVTSGRVVFVDAGGTSLDASWLRGSVRREMGAEMGGANDRPVAMTLVIGPEGGFADGEIPPGAPVMGLGRRILRTETAAMVAAALVLDVARRAG